MASPDSRILDELYQECAAPLLRFFTRRHGSEETARDLVQETFLRLARDSSGARQAASPKAYLFGIARHLSLSAWRRSRRDTLSDAALLTTAAPQVDPRMEAAREVIATMPALQREVLDLRLQQGLSYLEIAGALGIPVGTVRSRLHNAVDLLRSTLLNDEPSTQSL